MSLEVAAPSNPQNYIDGVSGNSYSANHVQHLSEYSHNSLTSESPADDYRELEIITKQPSPNTNVSSLQENCPMRNPAMSPPGSSPSSQNLPQCSDFVVKQEIPEDDHSGRVTSLKEALNQTQVYSNVQSNHMHKVDFPHSQTVPVNDLRTNFRSYSEPEQQGCPDGTVNDNNGRENLDELSAENNDAPLSLNGHNSNQVSNNINNSSSQQDSLSEAVHSDKSENEYQHYLATRRLSDSGSYDDDGSQQASLMSAYHGEARDSFMGMSGALNKQEVYYCHLCNYVAFLAQSRITPGWLKMEGMTENSRNKTESEFPQQVSESELQRAPPPLRVMNELWNSYDSCKSSSPFLSNFWTNCNKPLGQLWSKYGRPAARVDGWTGSPPAPPASNPVLDQKTDARREQNGVNNGDGPVKENNSSSSISSEKVSFPLVTPPAQADQDQGNSKFLFSEHMNTHFEHQCPHCDYTSRTEGRLKRHIKDFHSQTPPETYAGNRMMNSDASRQQQQQQQQQEDVTQRQKIYRCKQCDFAAIQKTEFWEHAKTHIKAEKILQCPKCPFVTEYKHHLEYHLRNHFGSKPFKCNKCNYSCVNKSMLNSHMKSHTNVYQYRCADCTYATKYCHSLKLHLRKYNHKAATVLNTDGSLPIDGTGDFDLVSKRGPPRGPRGPRKERDMPNVHMSPVASGLSPNMLLHQAAAANGLHPHNFNAASLAASAFWPLLGQFPNGLQPPPPLVPVSGLGMFPGGLQPPSTPNHEAKASPHKDRQPQKCNMCEYAAESMSELNQHMLKVHAAENNDLFSMFGISQEALEEHAASKNRALANHYSQMLPATPKSKQLLSMSEVKSEPRSDQKSPCSPKSSVLSTPRSWPTPMSHSPPSEVKSSYPSTPYLDRDSPLGISVNGGHGQPLSSSKKAIAEDMAANIEEEIRQNGEIPLDLTKPKGYNGENSFAVQSMLGPENTAKRKLDYGPPSPSQDKVVSTSPEPLRKRSRKGQAFKLDTICMKLQEKCSGSPTQVSGYESNEEYMSDYASERGEEGDMYSGDARAGGNGDSNREEDDQSNIDYLEIHNNLRELNQNSDEEVTREYPFDVSESSSQCQLEKPDDGESKINNIQAESTPIVNRRKHFVVRRSEVSQDTDTLLEDHVSNHISDNNNHEIEEIPTDAEVQKSNNKKPCYECQYCQMSFRDCVMYTMHIGYHGYKDPFKCNMCGHQSANRVEFFLHIAREAHSSHGQPA